MSLLSTSATQVTVPELSIGDQLTADNPVDAHGNIHIGSLLPGKDVTKKEVTRKASRRT